MVKKSIANIKHFQVLVFGPYFCMSLLRKHFGIGIHECMDILVKIQLTSIPQTNLRLNFMNKTQPKKITLFFVRIVKSITEFIAIFAE